MSYVAAAYVAVGVLAALLLGLWCATLYLLQRALTPKIFLSYRRADQETTGVPDRLWEDLHKRYGIENVFRDVYGILPGDSFERELHGRLSVCNVVVAVVGDDWEGRTSAEAAAQPWVMYQVVIGDDREGRTSADNSLRIQDPKDWVRYEVDHGRKEHKLLVVRAKKDDTRPTKFSPPHVMSDDEAVRAATVKDEFITEVRGLQRIVMTPSGDTHDMGLAQLVRAIERRHLGRGRLLLKAWVPVGVVAVLLAGALGSVYAFGERSFSSDDHNILDDLKGKQSDLATKTTNLTMAIDQIPSKLEANRNRIEAVRDEAVKQLAIRYLPIPFEQFFPAVQHLPKREQNAYRGAYVSWSVKFKKVNNAKSPLTLEFTSVSGTNLLLAQMENDSFPDWWDKGNEAAGKPVLVTGYILGVWFDRVTLHRAHLYPQFATAP